MLIPTDFDDLWPVLQVHSDLQFQFAQGRRHAGCCSAPG